MVTALGHYGVGLLLAALGVRALDRTDGLRFTGAVLATTMLPDLDASLPWFVHRGLTHTLGFAVAVGVAGGLLTAVAVGLRRRGVGDSATRRSVRRTAGVVALGLATGVGGHVLIDAFTIIPPFVPPMRPLWPVWRGTLQVEIVPPFAVAWNVGPFVVGLVAYASALFLPLDGRLPIVGR